MILRYGSYAHDQNECALVISQRAVYSARGERQLVRETWRVTGIKQAATQTALTAALAELRSAYNVNGRDLGLFLDDGVTPTDHVLNSSLALGGVRVLELEFPEGTGAEYSTFRTYRLTVEADFPDRGSGLLEFDEALSFEGTGGPRRVFLETLEGPPQEQIGAQLTTCRATQQGRAVGDQAYPVPPPPIWPAAELPERRRITLKTPQRTAGDYTRFAIEWQYTFESATPLSALPNLR
ncbi:MAG: hypothetical protein ACKV0T_02760 [Planctomycetales bacterium]